MLSQFFNDTPPPWIAADQGAVTLASTDKALVTVSALPNFGANFWNYIGRKVEFSLFGKITTAATPGNGTIGIYYGTGADANGVLLGSSAAQTLIASQTNLSWEMKFKVHVRSLGNAGTLFVTGKAFFNTAVIAAGTFLIPASAAVVSGACDLTAALFISPQFKRSGSTAETMTVQDIDWKVLN